MAKKLIDTEIKLGKGTLLEEAILDASHDYPIEQDNGSNWQWIKMKSGILYQEGRIEFTNDINTAWGSIYTSNTNNEIVFPIIFKDVPIVTVSAATLTSSSAFFGNYNRRIVNVDRISHPIHPMRPTSASNVRFEIVWKAVGIWK